MYCLVPTSVCDDEAARFYPAGAPLKFDILGHNLDFILDFLVHFILHYRAVIPERPKPYILQGFGGYAVFRAKCTDHMPDTRIKPEKLGNAQEHSAPAFGTCAIAAMLGSPHQAWSAGWLAAALRAFSKPQSQTLKCHDCA